MTESLVLRVNSFIFAPKIYNYANVFVSPFDSIVYNVDIPLRCNTFDSTE